MNKRQIITNFKNDYQSSAFIELYDLEGFSRCIVTGEMIFYPNTSPRFSKNTDSLNFRGTSPMTYKEINGVKYPLMVSYNGMIVTFGEEYLSKNLSRIYNQLNKFTKFAFQIPDIVYAKAKELGFSTPVTLNNLIKKHGKELGTEKFNAYRKKQSYSNSFEYKSKTYGWTKQNYKDFNLSRAVTLDNLIKKYGKEVGTEKFEIYKEKQAYTNSIDYFIEKFGKGAGTEKYLNIIKSKSKYFSNISQNLFDKLNVEDSMYATKNGEKYFKIKDKRYFVDFYSESLKLIIEYNGDKFHGNPNIYEKDSKPNPFSDLTADQLRNKDLSRYNDLRNLGYLVLEVWHSEYKLNQEKVISYLKQKINERRNSISI